MILIYSLCKKDKFELSKTRVYPLRLNAISHSYQLGKSISILRVVGSCLGMMFIQIFIEILITYGEDPDHSLHFAYVPLKGRLS